jgi:hypothetical protein
MSKRLDLHLRTGKCDVGVVFVITTNRYCAGIKKPIIAGPGNPAVEDIPKRRANGYAKRHGGGPGWAKAQVIPMKWGHLIRRPAKLTGTRHELCIWGEPTRPGVGVIFVIAINEGGVSKRCTD